MWTPQAIVALILALAILVALAGAIIARFLGVEPSERIIAMWEAFLTLLAGGLLAWIGTGRKGDD